jgi:hypothetical protein
VFHHDTEGVWTARLSCIKNTRDLCRSAGRSPRTVRRIPHAGLQVLNSKKRCYFRGIICERSLQKVVTHLLSELLLNRRRLRFLCCLEGYLSGLPSSTEGCQGSLASFCAASLASFCEVAPHREVILLYTEAQKHAFTVYLLFCLARSMSSVFGFRQGELERLFTTALKPNLNRCVFNVSVGRDRTFFKKKFGPKLPVQKVYEVTLCPVQKISTSHKSTFSGFMTHGRLESRVFTVSMSDPGPRKCNFYRQNAPFESGRGTGEGGRKRGIAAARTVAVARSVCPCRPRSPLQNGTFWRASVAC